MNKKYVNILVSLFEENYDFFYADISELPFKGIEENNDELIICFEEQDFSVELVEFISTALTNIQQDAKIIDVIYINEQNWNEEWEKNVPAIVVSDKIGIAPEWKINELSNPIKIIINPKMSFGTGSHISTRLCCVLMEEVVQNNSLWLDVGTGTGVLAILAIKLGATKCIAFDNDKWSFENAAENISLNSVSDNIELSLSELDTFELPESDGIVANLFIHLINSSFSLFYKSLKKSGGDLIVSGILSFDKETVIKNAQANGFELIKLLDEEEWSGFHFKVAK